MSLELITKEVAEIKSGLSSQINTAANAVVEEKAKQILEKVNGLETALKAMKGLPEGVSAEQITKSMADVETLTKDFEQFQKDIKEKKHEGKRTFGQVYGEAITKHAEEIGKVSKGRSVKFELDLKSVANMTNSNNLLSGDGVVTHNGAVILPGTKLNLRDLLPTSQSGTLVSAYHRESAGEGSISKQTEGSGKSQIDFDFSEVKVTTAYVSGYARFAKQLMKNLPFLNTTLQRLLLREFYNAENSAGFTTISGAATGSTATAHTDDVLQLIDYIANQRTAKFNASVVLTSWKDIAGMNKRTFTNGYYSGSGGVLTRVDGSMAISGVPIVGADWVTENNALILDLDYVERVEAESLVIEFFEQDSDNVQKNLITARIECLEEFSPMLPASMIYASLGAVS